MHLVITANTRKYRLNVLRCSFLSYKKMRLLNYNIVWNGTNRYLFR
ncbi:hypothetical protein A1OE_831 [Candidatus Endolissoclinum faulkneri L2]|uniref:Uncharacterized protein n=1 Tax=Candidatus Endolissoclinum faulkneri L2 TaxID=1193729 RepID=K7ZCZ1_9PROT|nr:hypothetical protein A1OE_831 [Candidatus Endolissoclinum faulkneri L2]